MKPKTKTVTDIMIVKIKNRPATQFGRSALVLVFALLCGNSLQAQTATPMKPNRAKLMNHSTVGPRLGQRE